MFYKIGFVNVQTDIDVYLIPSNILSSGYRQQIALGWQLNILLLIQSPGRLTSKQCDMPLQETRAWSV